MKKALLIALILVLLPLTVRAGDAPDSTTARIAVSIFEQLRRDTTGTESLPLYLAQKYARIGVSMAGIDMGIEASKPCTSVGHAMSMLVDTALIRVMSVTFDSASYPRRNLRELPFDSLTKMQFGNSIEKEKNATHYAVWGDSLLLAPVSSDADVFTVRYYKRADYPDSVNQQIILPEEYRELAVLWGCYKASERLVNGRDQEFMTKYYTLRSAIWNARIGVMELSK